MSNNVNRDPTSHSMESDLTVHYLVWALNLSKYLNTRTVTLGTDLTSKPPVIKVTYLKKKKKKKVTCLKKNCYQSEKVTSLKNCYQSGKK